MARGSSQDAFIATETFVVEIDGVPEYVEKDKTIVHRASAVYRKNPHMFRPLEVSLPEVEQATAAPGERRGEA